MSSQQTLLDLFVALSSKKKKDKLGGLINLLGLLKQEDILKILFNNSKFKESEITWDILFIKTHNASVSLIDEYVLKKKKIYDKHVQLIQDVILLVFKKSLHGKNILINPNLIASFVLSVFESDFRIKYLGYFYLNFFDKYIISERKTWFVLKEEYWIGIKNICIKHFSDPPQGIKNVFFLNLLNDIVRFSSKNCQISHDFLDLFSFLKDIYKCKKQPDCDFKKTLLHLTNTLCLQLAIEFRYEVCEFMENIFESVILCNEKSNSDMNILVYHFLTAMINIHNPNGLWEENTFYASDVNKWKNQLNEIYAFCNDKIKLILKNPYEIQKEDDLLNLFVDVVHVIMECNLENLCEKYDSEEKFDEPGPSKKCRYSFELRNCVSEKEQKLPEKSLDFLLSNLNSSDNWFWLKFLELLLFKYPLSSKYKYCQCVELLHELLCKKKDVENKQTLLRCIHNLLEVNNYMCKELTISNIQLLDELWNNISTELIRSLYTETDTEIHLLIRSLISHSKLQDIEPLIGLYCSGVLQPSLENFKTLCAICQHCILPEIIISEKTFKNKQQNYEKVRVELLKWLFQGDVKFPCSDLAQILIVLILKKFEEDITTSVPKDSVLISYISINDFCNLITQNYLTTALKNLKFVKESNMSETSFEIRIESCIKKQLFDFLNFRFQNLSDFLNSEASEATNELKAVEDCLWLTELICHILSHFQCTNDNGEDYVFLTKLLKSTLFPCSTKCLDLLKLKFFDLTCFYKLFSASFHIEVQKKIREPEFINVDFLQYVYEKSCEFFYASDQDSEVTESSALNSFSRFSKLIKNPNSVLHFQSLSKIDKIIVNNLEMLCQFVVIPGSLDSNSYQTVLAVRILKSLNCWIIPDSSFYLQLVLRIVYIFTNYDGINALALNDCLNLMEKVFKSQLLDFEVLITGLQVFKDLIALVHKSKNEDAHLKYQKILNELRYLIVIRKKCGMKAACKFIECLAEYSRIDFNIDLKYSDGSFSLLEEIIGYLKHPYHEVRLSAAQHVGPLFVCDKNTSKSKLVWQKEMLKKLYEMLKDDSDKSFANERDCVFQYYQRVMSSTSLIALTSVICFSSYWRKKTLFYLIYLSIIKNFKTSDVEDALKLICNELKINNNQTYILQNFFYLFYKCTKKGLQIQDFPFRLLGYKTVIELIENQYPVIVTVYARTGSLDDVNTISVKLKKSLSYVINGCRPQLLAFLLPALNHNFDSELFKKAQTLKSFMDKTSNLKAFQCMAESVQNVILNMVQNMHDPPYLLTLCEFFGNFKDDKSPVGYKSDEIVKALKIFDTDLLGKIAKETPSGIEKILRLLLKNVVTAVIYEDRIFAFYKYIFFVEIVAKATSTSQVYRNINSFIIRDVVYTLAGVLRKAEDEFLTDMACECFRKLIDYYLEKFNSIVGEFLPTITTVLTPVVSRGNKKALEILSYLVCQSYSELKNYIAFLDIFPPEAVYAQINKQIKKTQMHVKDLKSTVKHFISTVRNSNPGCRIEGLKNLYKMLSDKKLELKEMYEELKLLRGFSEDCKNSLLHQLICMLVELTSDENITVRTEASKCLGELGPCDLTTLVLKPENNFVVTHSSSSAEYRLIKCATRVLSDLIISENYEIKNASSRTLYAILSTKVGKEVIQCMEESSENFEYLTPFICRPDRNLKLNLNSEEFIKKFSQHDFWKLNNHEKWIANLMESLLQFFSDSSGVTDAFIELIRLNWQFAEKIFPKFVDFIFSLNVNKCNELISESFSAFFEKNFHYTNKTLTNVNKTSVHCILNVVDYIRIQRNHEGFYQRFELNINYLHVAKAALYCSAYFTSIFFAELWFEEKRQNINDFHADINMICELFPEEGFALAEILRECHFKIGNLDGIHGCGYMHILNPISEIHHYEHLKNWTLSMLYHDIQLSQGNTNSEISLINSLEQFGMPCTVSHLIKTFPETPELTAVQYKCAAKLSDWSLLESTYKKKKSFTPVCFDKCYYFALKAFHFEDDATFKNECLRARNSVLNELSHCSLESSKNLYFLLSELQCLKELEEFAEAVKSSNVRNLAALFDKWNSHDSIKCSEFKLINSVLTNRTIMIKDTWEKEKNKEMKDCLQSMLCQLYYKLTVVARKEKKFEIAARTLSFFDHVIDSREDIAGKMKIEKARIMWERGDREIGKFLLNHFLKKNEILGELKLKSLRIYGDWMRKTKSENSREIIENYFLKSIPESKDAHDRIHCYASIAALAYNMYEQFNEYLSSPLFEMKQNLISTQQDLASELRQELGRNQNREKIMAYQIAAKQSAIDENEIKNSKIERDSYLKLAIKYYLLSLKEGEKYNLVVFRIISLWLSNCSNVKVIKELQTLLHQIPTYKFLCLLPQLVPRMTDVSLISDLIEKILHDHPYHTLPLLFALSNSYEDLKYNNGGITIINPRVLAASGMIKKFETDEKLEKLIFEMRLFSSALIELANYRPSEQRDLGSCVSFPEHLQINRINNLTTVFVPSLQIPYNKNCVYNKIIWVRQFEKTYHLVGGINLPKRITCVGSDGIKRPLLVKGKDDLRQDAVMQQVFTIMNSLLYQNKDTSKRKLVIRTYKVVPLSQRSGIIEWCQNTQPLSLYLTGPNGRSGAHKKYFPKDTSAYDCRCLIKKVFALPGVTNKEKLKVFLETCRQIHPVFHYFFIEKFPPAGVWFERRLAYIHSVATTSMIGYILGIGDRHVHNILIDNETAEVIHIDLGIAFEQGKILPTPETVPFRLTRDIVDAMGSSGVEGDFRISCIKTMEVLRENQDAILTLLEVLLYDPLYTWTITPEKACLIQNHPETSSAETEKSSLDPETNKMAERALIRLKEKLQGTEAGFEATTVEGQVRILINEARDPNNLCRLFHGWQAYL